MMIPPFKHGTLAMERRSAARWWLFARRSQRPWVCLAIGVALLMLLWAFDRGLFPQRTVVEYAIFVSLALSTWTFCVWRICHWRTTQRTIIAWLLCLERLTPHGAGDLRRQPRQIVQEALDALHAPLCPCHEQEPPVTVSGTGSAEQPLIIDMGDATRRTPDEQEQ